MVCVDFGECGKAGGIFLIFDGNAEPDMVGEGRDNFGILEGEGVGWAFGENEVGVLICGEHDLKDGRDDVGGDGWVEEVGHGAYEDDVGAGGGGGDIEGWFMEVDVAGPCEACGGRGSCVEVFGLAHFCEAGGESTGIAVVAAGGYF